MFFVELPLSSRPEGPDISMPLLLAEIPYGHRGGMESCRSTAFEPKFLGHHHPIWIEVILVSWFCTNALVFIRSVIPLRLKPTKSFPEGPPSDGLELKNLFFK